jgi:hypothetical protein
MVNHTGQAIRVGTHGAPELLGKIQHAVAVGFPLLPNLLQERILVGGLLIVLDRSGAGGFQVLTNLVARLGRRQH